MMMIEADLQAAIEQLDHLDDRVSEALRPATLTATRLIFNEIQIRAPQSERGHWFYGTNNKYWFEPGSLKKSIYIKYLPEVSEDGQARYYKLGWREKSSELGYVPYAHMVEYGTARAPAHPFVRPSYDAKHKQAEQLIVDMIKEAARNGD